VSPFIQALPDLISACLTAFGVFLVLGVAVSLRVLEMYDGERR
jgi:hypothetical protein